MITDSARAATSPLDVARALAPRIRERADEIEAARQLPRDLVLEIANAKLFKVAISEAEGGLGADILTTLRVIEEVARADGSTGWCLAMGINSFRQSAQFAPEVRRTLFHSDPIGVSAGSANPRGRAVAVPGGYRVTGPMNRMHGFDLAGCGFCCVGLGVARAAVDEFVELAQVKVPRSSSELLRDRPLVQARIGEAEALLRSGRALLFDTVQAMWQTVVAGEFVTERQRSDLRMAMTHAAQSAAQATHMVCATAGTTSIFNSSPLERYARDAEVVTRHNQLQFVNYEAVGRTMLGLESNSPLF